MSNDWDDPRLDAAFAQRAEAARRPTGQLALLTIEQMQRQRSRPQPIVRLGALGGLATAIVLAVVATFGAGLRQPTPGASASPDPSTARSTRSDSAASYGPTGAPDSSVLTVSEALAGRDAESEADEITVGGWLRGGVPVPCPLTRDPNPARLDCPPARPWIVERSSDAGAGVLNVDPSGPGFQPSFALIYDDVIPDLTAASSLVEITVTGHFHDRRATLCPTIDCDSTFVVDRIDSVASRAVPISTSYDLSITVENGTTVTGVEIAARGPADQFDNAVLASGGALAIVAHRTMSIDGLLRAEPALAAGWPGIGTATVVTSITAVQSQGYPPRSGPKTYLVPDGSAFVYQMTRLGPVPVIGLPSGVAPGDLVEWLGDPITVAHAIDHRDQALDSTEILVRGFAWAPPPLYCSLELPSMPVLDQCPSTATWLADRLPASDGRPGRIPRPDGPAVNLVVPPEAVNLADLAIRPTAVVALGHFDDHRSSSCPADAIERCHRNFIVDAILSPDHLVLDRNLALSTHPGPSNIPKGTADWAASVAGLTDADRSDRLISSFPVAVAALSAFEPNTLGTASMAEVETVWLVHFLDEDAGRPIVRTRIVTDARPGSGTARVFDVSAGGITQALAAAP